MSTLSSSTVETGRVRIDEIDAEIVRLIEERTSVSREIQAARALTGGPRVVHARENEVVGRWRAALGRPGATIAVTLLELGRGRAS